MEILIFTLWIYNSFVFMTATGYYSYKERLHSYCPIDIHDGNCEACHTCPPITSCPPCPTRPKDKCADGFLEHIGICYHFSNNKKSWYEAKSICERFGSVLAAGPNEDRNEFLQSRMLTSKHNEHFWIGGTDKDREGYWKWLKLNEPIMGYKDWCSNEPSNSNNNEHCLQMKAEQFYCWNDEDCSKHFYYVCEYSLK